jgi:endonuclease III related protein
MQEGISTLKRSPEEQIRKYYQTLHERWGPQHWWPAHSRFEVIVGAYLTQNTAWTNVEKALAKLRGARLLHLNGIRRAGLGRLEKLIRPAGYFRQKARRLKTFVAFLDKNYEGSLDRMFAQPTARLREQLLALHGVGPETADSILLYAGHHEVFVVDAYTRRMLERHEIAGEKAGYEAIRELFERALETVAMEVAGRPPGIEGESSGAAHPPSPMSRARRSKRAQVLNEMHGLVVGVGKNYCAKSQPKCDECPLRGFLPGGKVGGGLR